MIILAFVIIVGRHAKADFTFGEPTNLGPAINSPDADAAPCLSADGLSIYFTRGENVAKIWVARRATRDSEWGSPSKLGPPINTADNGTPFITPNGLMLFVDSSGPGGYGSWDLWVTTRATTDDDWGTLINLGATVNSASEDWGASMSADGLELYFTSGRYGSYDLWRTTRATTDDNWGPRVKLGPTLNTSANESFPSISADGLLLFFASNRPGGLGSGFGLWDLYMAKRETTQDPWGPPMNLGPMVNSTSLETGVKISADGSMLYFHSNRPGGVGPCDIWQVPVKPVVDLNGDGIVDAADVCIMVDHWGTDEPLCDIGPMPWGDGIVDVQDLIVLAEHLFEEVPPVEVEPNE